MAVRFTFTGLDELHRELRNLPAHLTGEGANIVEAEANAAATEIRAAYPVRTGNLRDHVVVEHSTSGFGTVSRVKNTARHAFIFENGTQARHNSLGANRGAMPAGNVFIPIMIRRRRTMYQKLADLLRRAGLQVSGG